MNNRLLEVKADIKQSQSDIEMFDDATSELMMLTSGKVMVMIGESFVESSEEYANNYCELKTQVIFLYNTR